MAAPSAVVKRESNLRERTATRPILRESQVRRSTVSHSIDTPMVKEARRQCSVSAHTDASTSQR